MGSKLIGDFLDSIGHIVKFVIATIIQGPDVNDLLGESTELFIEDLVNLIDSLLNVLLHGREDTAPAIITLFIWPHVDQECVQVW